MRRNCDFCQFPFWPFRLHSSLLDPFHLMNMLRDTAQGAVTTFRSSLRGLILHLCHGHRPRATLALRERGQYLGSEPQRATSLPQIQGALRLREQFGHKVATPEETRQLCKVGVWCDSVDETLKSLDPPPNPATYSPGFQVWETDGRKTIAPVVGDSHQIAACMLPPQTVVEEQKKRSAA